MDPIAALSSPDYATRYEAANSLLLGRTPERVQKLEALVRTEAASPETRTAAAFVLWKWSGGRALSPVKHGRRPDFILISADTLRPDHLGCYGYSRDTSPELDKLAGRGAVFTNAFTTAPWTLPAHMSIFTSLYPSYHKLDATNIVGNARLDESETTLTQTLRERGYTNVGFVAHPFLAAEWGFSRGFHLYENDARMARRQAVKAMRWLDWHRFHLDRSQGPANFFLFLHFIDPHETYSAPRPYGQKFTSGYAGKLRPEDHLVTMFRDNDFETEEDLQYVLDLYDGEISYLDAQLGMIFDKLDALGLSDTTAVIFTSDHGEEFKDHGSMGHSEKLYEEQLRVPFVLTYPAGVRPGQRVEQPISLVDVSPTILELAGGAPSGKAQGMSVLPFLAIAGSDREPRSDPRRDLFAELGPLGHRWEKNYYRRSIRSWPYKLIITYSTKGERARELFDLSVDPGEQKNVYEARREDPEIQELERRLEAFAEAGVRYHPEFREKNSIDLDEQIQERLRSLGYVNR